MMRKNRLKQGLLLGAILFQIGYLKNVLALDDTSYAVGRYWGQDPKAMPEVISPSPRPRTLETPRSAKAVLNNLTEMIDEAKAKAVLEPTFENVKNFMILKNKTGNMATQFSQVWQQVLLHNAYLDYSAFRPTNNRGIVVFNKRNQEKINNFLMTTAKHNGLIYFYQGKDLLAQLQAPIIVKFAKKYNFEVIGVSVDGKMLNDFEKNAVDNGHGKRMGVQKIPALFAMHPSTGEYWPLSYTVLAERELEQRVFDVLSHFETGK